MWQTKNNSLYKKFTFKSFGDAFGFISQVAKVAERDNHHPKWTNDYNEVEIWLTTHSAGKVTPKDKKLAEEIDKIVSGVDVKSSKLETLKRAKLFTDGGSRGNPGPSAVAYALLNSDDIVVKKNFEYLGETTNNQAEYKGLLLGLEASKEMGVLNLEVYMDSLLVVNQVKGLFKIKNQELLPLTQKVKELSSQFETISFTHVPREMNKIADQLVNDCLDQNT